MADLFSEHKGGFWTPERKHSLYLGLLLVALALVVQVNAGHYSSENAAAAPSVSDLFLDNLPVVHLDLLLVPGIISLWVLSCWLIAVHPKYLLFSVKAIGLFIIFRAFFMSLTHIGLYPNAASPDAGDFGFGFYHLTTYRGNLFFSGHTGFPVLLPLIFWNPTFWRRFFLVATAVCGAAVLLAHVHYSIDVFAAPFIVYGIFVIGSKLFPRDYAIMGS